ncbi:MAG TPA: hypothetical protein EYP69_00455 [Bacteroidales bacterium]|nr:hypothetical protein [Bacteroidales bacterium]
MSNFYKYYLSLFFVSLIFYGCNKPVKYSDIPAITFSKLLVTDTVDALDNTIVKGTLIFDFVDGDGDIGLQDGDTIPPYDSVYFYNLYITEYYVVNDSFVEANPVVPYHYRIPYIAATGQNIKRFHKNRNRLQLSPSTRYSLLQFLYLRQNATSKQY